MIAKKREKTTKQKFSWQLVYKQRYLLLMSVPFVVWLIVFKYVALVRPYCRYGVGQWHFRMSGRKHLHCPSGRGSL